MFLQIDSDKNAVQLTKAVCIGSGFHPTDIIVGFEKIGNDPFNKRWEPIVERGDFVYVGKWDDFAFSSRKKILELMDNFEYDEVDSIYYENFI